MKLRFDRNKLLIGTYCLAEYARSEAHVQALREAGIDFLCGVPASDRALMDKCEKYGIGVFANGVLPGWWGGHGEKAGGFKEAVPVEAYRAAREKYMDHPAIWALDTGDEPSALEFPHYGRLFEEAKQLFPELMPYLNLYPNYGVLATCTEEQVKRQLGTETYAEHIDRFIEHVNCDYVCYDYYMYSASAEGAYENLRVVSDRCRASGRDMWIVLQVNSSRAEEWISLNQLRHQAYTALSFGARSINWACWTAGWWHNLVLDKEGQPTRQYDRMCKVNRELHAMGERYMKYRNQATQRVKPDKKMTDRGLFEEVSVDGGRSAFVGFMEKDSGSGQAVMIADCESEKAYHVKVVLREGTKMISALLNGVPVSAVRTGEREYLLRMEESSGLLIEVE